MKLISDRRKRLLVVAASLLLLSFAGCEAAKPVHLEMNEQEITSTTAITTTMATTAAFTTTTEPKKDYDEDYVESPTAICYDVKSGEILYEKNAGSLVYPASMTKMMTALLVSEYGQMHKFVVGDEIEMIDPQSSVAFLSKGLVLDLHQILLALIVPSGNDAAYTAAVNIARLVGGDMSNEAAIAYFAKMMNAKALELGMEHTNFICPDGFHDDNHYTTARDFLKLAVAVSHNEDFLSATGISYIEVIIESGQYFAWENGNSLYKNKDYNVIGLKSGYTDEAGRCFCALDKDEKSGRETIAIVFGSENLTMRDTDITKLLDLNK